MNFSSSKISFSTNNQTISLVWPDQTGTPLTEIQDIYNIYGGCTLVLPKLNIYNPSYVSLLSSANNSLESFTLKDTNNNTIAVIAAGEIFLIKCSYSAQSWDAHKLATTAVTISAKELQGNGLSSWLGNLTTICSSIKTVPLPGEIQYALNAQDQSALLLCKNTGNSTIFLPANVCVGFFTTINNVGTIAEGDVNPTAGVVTIQSQINSGALINQLPTFTLQVNQSAMFVFDGANWWTATVGNCSPVVNKFTAIDVSSYTTAIQLTPKQMSAEIIYFYTTTGTVLENTINIYVQPDTPKVWVFANMIENQSILLQITQGSNAKPIGQTFTVPKGANTTLFTTLQPGFGLQEGGTFTSSSQVVDLVVQNSAQITNLSSYATTTISPPISINSAVNVSGDFALTQNNQGEYYTANIPSLKTITVASSDPGGTIGLSSNLVCASNVSIDVPGGISSIGSSSLSTLTATNITINGAANANVPVLSVIGSATAKGTSSALSVSGNANITGTVTAANITTFEVLTPSSAVLKTEVNDIDLYQTAVELFKSIPFSCYKYVDQQNHQPGLIYGVIAEKLQKIWPEAVVLSETPIAVPCFNTEVSCAGSCITFYDENIKVGDALVIGKEKKQIVTVININNNLITLSEELDNKTVYLYGKMEQVNTIRKDCIFELACVVLKHLLEQK